MYLAQSRMVPQWRSVRLDLWTKDVIGTREAQGREVEQLGEVAFLKRHKPRRRDRCLSSMLACVGYPKDLKDWNLFT